MYLYIYIPTSLQIDSLIDRNLDFHRFHRYLCICTYLHLEPHPCRSTETYIFTDSTDSYVFVHTYIFTDWQPDRQKLGFSQIPQIPMYLYIPTSWTTSLQIDRTLHFHRLYRYLVHSNFYRPQSSGVNTFGSVRVSLSVHLSVYALRV